MRVHSLDSLAAISPTEWNALVADSNPFLSHEFLAALERHHCVGEDTGWLPRHLVCQDDNGRLVAAMPCYSKSNSYGEFVFDWGWAEAFRRQGQCYYPKLLSAIPYTPATSHRLLVAPHQPQATAAREALIEALLEASQVGGYSSAHCLFPTLEESALFQNHGFMTRLGCQFHWQNPGYRDFQDFLDALTAKRRKNIKRERRLVSTAGLELRVLQGWEISESQWFTIHKFYRSTFQRLGGVATLSLPFFWDIAQSLGERLIVVLAYGQGQEIAAAISFRSNDTLYGRHWGCRVDYDSLHFEACYYQGLDYCIQHGLQRFEPGAQGEHKIHRGFLPTLTYSAHWIVDPGWRQAVKRFLASETPAVRDYAQQLQQHSPYRTEVTAHAPALAGPAR